MKPLKFMSRLFLVVSALVFTLGAEAQSDPKAVLRDVIRQLQTGTPNPMWYSPQLWQVIAQQTGGSGVYPQLQQLGKVTSVTLNQTQQLPAGRLYSLTADHKNGTSTWVLGVGSVSNRLEYANFSVGALEEADEEVKLPKKDKPPEQKKSEGCERFPLLCPK